MGEITKVSNVAFKTGGEGWDDIFYTYLSTDDRLVRDKSGRENSEKLVDDDDEKIYLKTFNGSHSRKI